MKDTALQSIELIPEQAKQALSEAAAIPFPDSFREAENIVIAGMGGSMYVFYVLESLYKTSLTRPLSKLNTYTLPNFVGPKTLFIASSYSGTTEEVIYNLKEAHKAGAMCVAVSNGGELIAIQKEHSAPYYQFEPKHNPSGQPRMGQGYMLFGMVSILEKLGYLNSTTDIAVLNEIAGVKDAVSHEARELATKLKGVIPVYVASDHLSGNAHIVRNQTNETAKLFADYNTIPELNHHLMEGLKNPKDKKLAFVFIDSPLYINRNRERLNLTKEVVEKNGAAAHVYTTKTSTRIAQFVEVLMWGGYMTYYMAADYKENPNAIPWVDYFKEKLGTLKDIR